MGVFRNYSLLFLNGYSIYGLCLTFWTNEFLGSYSNYKFFIFKEFRIMGLSINDSVYSSLFFFLTGLHFFHLLVGLLLCCLFFWGCSFPFKIEYFLFLRVSEVLLFYNL